MCSHLDVGIGGILDDGGESIGDVVPVTLVRQQPILGPVLGLGLPRAPHDGYEVRESLGQ